MNTEFHFLHFAKKHKIKPLDIKNAYRTMKKFSEYTNVPMWQLFASPEEVKGKNNVCPYCGMPIKLGKGE